MFEGSQAIRKGALNYSGGVVAHSTFVDGRPVGDIVARVFRVCDPGYAHCHTAFPIDKLLKIGEVNEAHQVMDLARRQNERVRKAANDEFEGKLAEVFNPLVIGAAKWIDEMLSMPVDVAASRRDGQRVDNSPRLGVASGSTGSATFACSYMCTNAKFLGADRTRLTVRVRAGSESTAREEAVRHAKGTCYEQTQRVYDTGTASCRKE